MISHLVTPAFCIFGRWSRFNFKLMLFIVLTRRTNGHCDLPIAAQQRASEIGFKINQINRSIMTEIIKILPSMICNLRIFSNFFALPAVINSSKYSLTSVKTSFFKTKMVNERFLFSNNLVKLANSSNPTNILYCSLALSTSNMFWLGVWIGRSIWCNVDPQLSSSTWTKRAQLTVARLKWLCCISNNNMSFNWRKCVF